MKKILGLDLGTNSIGWALTEIGGNNTPIRIIAMGSRIIPLNSDERDQFQKGQAISKNQDRTKSRTQRKGYDRKQLKKSDLKKVLKNLKIHPTEELLQLPSLELWKLRNDAASDSKSISAEQLGRILWMLNQKRGYKSARSEANQDKKDTDYVAEVKGRFAQLKDRNQTIGQYFYDELLQAKNNDTHFQIKNKVYPREAYIEEFDTIITTQQKKHNFLTNEVVAKLRNEIIYYQRKLKSQKELVSTCEFEGFEKAYFDEEKQKTKTSFVGPKVAPKTSPLHQLCKIWELVNNISLKIKSTGNDKYKWSDKVPTLEEKQQIVEHLSKNFTLTFSELLTVLRLRKEDVYVSKQVLKGIQGNTTYAEIQKCIGDDSPFLQFNLSIIQAKHPAILVDKKTGEILTENESLQIDPKIEQEPFYQIWHTIYSIKDLDECKKALIKRFAINEEIAEKLSKLDFNKQAFGNKSNKAMRKILPYLMQGYNYSQACSFAGYNHSNSLTKEEQIAKNTADKLELLSKNSLRQPVVEKIINQMINVVNAILDRYGKPHEIRIELARELKQSKDERNNADIRNSDNKKLNEEVSKRLTELGLPSTKRFIQKYKFIFPSKDKKLKDAQAVNQCIYCGKSFNLSEALSGDSFDVDHIVPQALLFDDSQTNKVLVHRSCNFAKNNQTAYDYIAAKGSEELGLYLERVDSWFKRGILSYGKMQRLKVSYVDYLERKKKKKETEADKQLWESFIDRQLRESQYIARKSKEILQQICNNVTSTEGTVTARLRKVWGWDAVLENLQFERFKVANQTATKAWTSQHGTRKHEKEEIQKEIWTKRDDHRHHAIDALVIASTQQGFIQRMNTLSSSEVRDEMLREIKANTPKNEMVEAGKILAPADSFKKQYEEKKKFLDDYLFSKRPFTPKEVELHAEQILVSFKSGKKVATRGVRKIKIDGKKKVVQSNIIVPRGALHEQFVYGKIKVIGRDFKTGSLIKYPLKYLFENVGLIAESIVKKTVEERLAQFGNDTKKAIDSLKKSPIYLDPHKIKLLLNSHCYKDEYVIKYKVADLKKNDLKFIVDEKIKQIVAERLDKFNGKEKEAFKDILWLNEAKQIPIHTVRCFTGLASVEAIKKNQEGKEIGFAIPGNNHHIAIYKNVEDRLIQHICTFWHAVERKKYNIPYIIKSTQAIWNSIIETELPQPFISKLPTDNLDLLFSLQQNEMFILGLPLNEVEEAIKQNNKVLLSKHLYLVWSISDNDYWFRHHLETKNSDLKAIQGAKESNRYFRFNSVGAFMIKTPVKIRLNHLGEITKIGEF